MDHCGFNVVVHGPGVDAWALSAYGRSAVVREHNSVQIGASQIVRDADGFSIHIEERTMLGLPIRGRVRLNAAAWQPVEQTLDGAGRHRWWPVVPLGHVEVELDNPRLRFAGTGYHDANRGNEALEQAFTGWRWTRGSDGERAAILYDVWDRDGTSHELGFECDRHGQLVELSAPGRVELASSRWRLPRTTRADREGAASIRQTLVDAPFYARTWIELALGGRRLDAMHEVVDLSKFTRATTQLMLPFRTRGVGWR